MRNQLAPDTEPRRIGPRPGSPTDERLATSLLLPGEPRSASLARRFAADVIPLLFPEHDPAAAVILVNELVTHAVVHGQRQIEVTLRLVGDALRMEVADPGGGRRAVAPTTPRATDDDPTMGLQIVQSIADRWGIDVADGGSVVWCMLRGWEPLD
ncbi:MAG TPA: ATP-binding protein [Acidimicrobiales bacterium]